MSKTHSKNTPVKRRRRSLPFGTQVLLVAIGGCIGTLFRQLFSYVWPTSLGGFPYATFAVNIIGSFLLGVLFEYVRRTGEHRGANNSMRLLLGVGCCGGFTTYSTFILEGETLIGLGMATLGIGYVIGSLVCGLLAAF